MLRHMHNAHAPVTNRLCPSSNLVTVQGRQTQGRQEFEGHLAGERVVLHNAGMLPVAFMIETRRTDG